MVCSSGNTKAIGVPKSEYFVMSDINGILNAFYINIMLPQCQIVPLSF